MRDKLRDADWFAVGMVALLAVCAVIIGVAFYMMITHPDHSTTQCTVIIISKTIYPVCG